MSSKIAISVRNLSKVYHIYDRPIDRLKQTLWRGKRRFYQEFFALRDVSFDIFQGETVGVIGRNGSGKSTLLQLIAGTLKPSLGEIATSGRISALLELGSGFNPSFTGRENAIVNGAIMGLTEEEIEQRLPMIERFADIGDFINQPVSLYSSGMFVRLAFACAISTDPDILVVDEALAVGDLKFQLRCIEKMKAFKEMGKTIFFVSHDITSIRNFCDKAIWLMDGRIHLSGDVIKVTDQYNDFMKSGLEPAEADPRVEAQKDILSINKTYFRQSDMSRTNVFKYGENIVVEIEYTLTGKIEDLVAGVALFNRQYVYVCGLNTKIDQVKIPSEAGNHRIFLEYTNLNLLPGSYYIDVGFFESSGVVCVDYKSKVNFFSIEAEEFKADGLVCVDHDWHKELSK